MVGCVSKWAELAPENQFPTKEINHIPWGSLETCESVCVPWIKIAPIFNEIGKVNLTPKNPQKFQPPYGNPYHYVAIYGFFKWNFHGFLGSLDVPPLRTVWPPRWQGSLGSFRWPAPRRCLGEMSGSLSRWRKGDFNNWSSEQKTL